MPQWHIKSVVIFAIHYTEKGSVLLELSLENGFHLFTNFVCFYSQRFNRNTEQTHERN